MSATAKVLRATGFGPSVEEVSMLGHQIARGTDALARQIGALESKPVTWADVLMKRVCHGFDLHELDLMTTKAHNMLKSGDHYFEMEGCQHSLQAALDALIETLELTRTYMRGTGR